MDSGHAERSRRRSRRFAAALIAVNVLLAVYFLAPQAVGDQVRRHLRSRLRAHYPHLDIQIASGRLVGEGVFVLEGVEFRSPGRGLFAGSRPVLRIERLSVLTEMQPGEVLGGSMPFRPSRIVADGLVGDVWQDESGTWSPELLWPPLVMDDESLHVEIRDGRLRLHKSDSGRPLELDNLRLAIDIGSTRPSEQTESTGPESPPADGSLTARFSLKAAGAFVEEVTVSGRIADQVALSGTATGLRINADLVGRLPAIAGLREEDLRGLSLLTDVQWGFGADSATVSQLPTAWRAAAADSPEPVFDPIALTQSRLSEPVNSPAASEPNSQQPAFAVECIVREGRFDHDRLPQPLERITGRLALTPSGIDVRWARMRFGESNLRVSGQVAGWNSEADLTARLIADGLTVNERLAAKLPIPVGDAWNDLRPNGPVDLDLRLSRQAGSWQTEGTAQLRGVDVQWSEFPYPVTQLIGPLTFTDRSVASEGLSGRVGGRRLSVAFRDNLNGYSDSVWTQLAVDGPVPIDAALISSLSPLGEPTSALEEFVRSLSPSGNVHLAAARFECDAAGVKRRSVDLRITGGSLRYKEFPYPLYDVRGRITVHDDWVRLTGFQAGNSDNARITCEGSFLALPDDAPHPTDGGWQTALRFRARDLPLDETLRAALSESSRRTWDQLSPSGVLDSVEVTVQHAEAWDEPRLTVAAVQQPRPTIDNRTVSLRAADIPYRLDIVEGAVRFDGTKIFIDSIDARHDSTRLAADGICFPDASGQWRLNLNVHSGSRLHPDAELIGSLPAEVRGAFQRLQLRGPISARGTVGVMLPDDCHPQWAVDWDTVLQLEGNRIADVGPVHGLRGEITMRGRRDQASVVADGEIAIDSMHIESQQLTAIRGPFALRDDRLLLGEALPAATSTHPDAAGPRPITGRLFEGNVTASGTVVLSDGEFDVVVSIADADVAMMLVELGEANRNVRGTAQGRVRLEGVVGAAHLLKGNGAAKLANANLYQLPLLISVFNMLRVTPSETAAFTDGEARFSVYGENLTFDELKLWGDLIALHGSGTMNRHQEVNLTFNTRVSPQNIWSQAIRPFGEHQYTLWTLNVKGPLSQPQIERRAMDTVNGTLERLIPGKGDLPVPPLRSRLGNLRPPSLR